MQNEQRTHSLKCEPQYFEQAECGNKCFEIRLNDRNYKVGDKIMLQEYDMTRGYTYRFLRGKITYLTEFQQQENYVVFGVQYEHHINVSLKEVKPWMVNEYKNFKERGEICRHNEDGIEELATLLGEAIIKGGAYETRNA